MLIDGNKIADQLYLKLAETIDALKQKPRLTIYTSEPNFETQKYLKLKQRKADRIGLELQIIEMSAASTDEFVATIKKNADNADGILVQLPLPAHFDIQQILAAIPKDKDPDGFHYDATGKSCLPPVVGAIAEIAREYNIAFKNKKVAVLGQGRLVGKPVALWAKKQDADVSVVDVDTPNSTEIIKNADIIISGIGQPNFITANLVKEGLVVFDAGTSESGGQLVGDFSPAVADKASLFTPVPGGIGPITVAVLLQNVIELASQSGDS